MISKFKDMLRPLAKQVQSSSFSMLLIIMVLILCTIIIAQSLPTGYGYYAVIGSCISFHLAYICSGLRVRKITDKIWTVEYSQMLRNFFSSHPRLSTGDLFTQYARKTSLTKRFDALPTAVISIDRWGVVSSYNLAAQKLLEISDGEHVKFSDLAEGLGRSVTQWLDVERTNKEPSKPQMVKAKRASNDLFLQVSLSNVGQDEKFEMLAVITDATEFKSLEAQFVQSQKMQAIGQLAGGVAHDFNNLLTAISGYCDLLKLRHEKGDPDYGDLDQIGHNANRAAALVGQLLAFSRKQTLQPKAVQVNDVLSDLTHLLNRLVGEKIHLRLDRTKFLPDAFVDSRQLEQVIMNLVVNARDAMTDGGSITIRTNEVILRKNERREKVDMLAGKYVVIEVDDDGEGIPKVHLSKIFEPFFSTKKVGEGTGLGLSTVYGIIKQTGGYIFVDSHVGKGTTFNLYLPVVHNVVVEKEVEPARISKPTRGLNGTLVLLVEDEDPVRTFASRALSMQGIKLLEARSGIEALAFAKEHGDAIDLIISDVIMPGPNGPEWYKDAKPYIPKSKVIFMSGYAEEIFDDLNEEIEIYGFLPKPFSLQALIQKASDAINDS